MSFFEQIKNQMEQHFGQQEASYLLPSDLKTVLGFCRTKPDVTKLEGCNVIAVLPVGAWMLFKISPPDRVVKTYSNGTGYYVEKDVVEVFNFIQSNYCAWTQI